MDKTNFEYCSLHYLRQWLHHEKPLHTALNSDNTEIIHRGLTDAVKFFIIARNLPRKYDVDRGLQRYKPLLDAFLANSNSTVTENNYHSILNQFQAAIRESYGGKNLISLSSKLLWLRYQDPFIIYDSRVRSSLKVPPGDYVHYAKEWLKSYGTVQEVIVNTCSDLPRIQRYVDPDITEYDLPEINDISAQPWFHKRVFDIYLWHIAGVDP
jgi:hypothetical protein